jgi:hypothetical protein
MIAIMAIHVFWAIHIFYWAPGAGIDWVISLLRVRRWQGRIISPKSGGIDSRRHCMKLAQRPKMANNMLGCAIEVTDKTRTGLS